MAPKTLLNVALLALVGTLTAVTVFEPGLDDPAPPPPPLTTLDRAAVGSLTITREGQDPVHLQRRGEHWWLTAPLTLPANGFKVDSVLDLLDAPSQGRVATSDEGLARFGLAPPKAAVDFAGTVVTLGDTEPLDGLRYVAVDGEVHLVRDRFYHHLLATAAGFADLAPLGPDARIERFDLGDGVLLERDDTGWRVRGGPGDLSADVPARLADAWRNARALGVEDRREPLPDGRTVGVWLAGGKDPVQFRVFEEDGDTLLARLDQGVQYRFTAAAGRELLVLTQGDADTAPGGDTGQNAAP